MSLNLKINLFFAKKMNEVKEKILTEEKLLNKKTEDLVREWDKEQPQSVIILI